MAFKSFVLGLASGAVLMYLWDPQQGPQRRETWGKRLHNGRERAATAIETSEHAFEEARHVARDTAERARTTVESIRGKTDGARHQFDSARYEVTSNSGTNGGADDDGATLDHP
ncbi:MAG: hypothetical protein WD904_06860 [Dehalococcoidia bacterium]